LAACDAVRAWDHVSNRLTIILAVRELGVAPTPIEGEKIMARPTRRIVTGHDAEGRSIILKDGPAPSIFELQARPGEAITELWRSGRRPRGNEISVPRRPPRRS
jgi:hypothetical protein